MLAIVVALLGAAAFAHMAPFPFLLEAFRPSKSVWRVKPQPGQPPTIYLTFDDGPNARWTAPLLDALRDHDVPATFFLIDEHITPETAPIVRRIADEGHAMALHSGTRRLMVMSPGDLSEKLLQASARIQSITSREPCHLFRPHAGWRSATMYEGLDRAGFQLAGWTWGMWDWDWWRTPRADRIAARLVRKASAGDIIVIHDGHHKNPEADRRHAAGTVRLLVPLLKAKGFSFGRLCNQTTSGIADRSATSGVQIAFDAGYQSAIGLVGAFARLGRDVGVCLPAPRARDSRRRYRARQAGKSAGRGRRAARPAARGLARSTG
ncbi:MAG: polysaccharide deacetylase family protein [Vicinamibacterales bacterium]